ncbi:uncharacterized protein [Leptinotarsa decemlineata]|uniref:uncharacterized protein n=1 Tax=Leptinotarsa decemlineata TaxID=7539 RepID=UPI003D30875C
MSQAAHDNLSDSEENNELLSKLLFKSSNETNPRNVTSHESTSEVANADAQPIISFQVPVNENFTLPPDIILHEIKSQNLIIPTNDKEVLDSSGHDENISNHDFNAEMEILDEEIQDNLQNTERGIITEASSNVNRLRRSREVTKLKRLRGESYIGYTRSKKGIIRHDKEREKIRMKGRCCHNEASRKKTSKSFLCHQVTEGLRKKSFDYFWSFQNWDLRKSYLRGLVSTTHIKRRRKENSNKTDNRKKQSHSCYLPLETGEKVLVCRTMLLHTFDLGRNMFDRWTSNFHHTQVSSNNQENKDNDEEYVTNHAKLNVTKSMKMQARQWLKDLPKVPSHYCRSSSTKMYLESVFRSTLHIYKVYVNFCTERNTKPVSRTLFTTILKSEKIAIHQPRKDQCDLCCSWKTGNIPENVYSDHLRKKNEAEQAKKDAKESASDEKLIITMDLQSVLLAPKLEASAVYYKQKLQIHNFTVYALNDKTVDLCLARKQWRCNIKRIHNLHSSLYRTNF